MLRSPPRRMPQTVCMCEVVDKYCTRYTVGSMTQNAVEASIAAAGITKAQLSHELQLGTTTIWRACTGRKIDAESAKKLRTRFPDLDFEALTLGLGPVPKTQKRKRAA